MDMKAACEKGRFVVTIAVKSCVTKVCSDSVQFAEQVQFAENAYRPVQFSI